MYYTHTPYQYAVIRAVYGLCEGYSDTTCELFPKRGLAGKHIKQILDDYRKDDRCVNIDTKIHDDSTTVTWVSENMDAVSVEVFKVVEIDMSNRAMHDFRTPKK